MVVAHGATERGICEVDEYCARVRQATDQNLQVTIGRVANRANVKDRVHAARVLLPFGDKGAGTCV
jgi:hypothetical protein